MVAKSTSVCVDVDVDLDDFDDDDLLDELVSRGTITRPEARAISDRYTADEEPHAVRHAFDPEDVEWIRRDLIGGRREEALISIERLLGREFIGLLSTST